MAEPEVTLTLRRPITVHGKEGQVSITALPLNLPSGRIVLEHGEPFTTKIEQDGVGGNKIEFRIIPALARQYLVDMSGHNADVLAQMHPLDVLAAYDALTKMLRPTEG